ncbi:MAG: DUF1428 domain-containing protein [Woeseiaceae bacterium]|nr:DUF1428 domain-containing protein [Woeseiaceae bacterium]
MNYIDGVIAAVPTANKERYRQHAEKAAAVFKKHGAISLTECWGDDVPEGKTNSMRSAVMLKPDETVVLSWIAWPDKATRDSGMEAIMKDPDMSAENNPMPFDGQRLIYGGFDVMFQI